ATRLPFYLLLTCPPLTPTLFPYTTLFRSFDENPVRMTQALAKGFRAAETRAEGMSDASIIFCATGNVSLRREDFCRLRDGAHVRSEEHTSELQSRFDLVCRLLLEKKKTKD